MTKWGFREGKYENNKLVHYIVVIPTCLRSRNSDHTRLIPLYYLVNSRYNEKLFLKALEDNIPETSTDAQIRVQTKREFGAYH